MSLLLRILLCTKNLPQNETESLGFTLIPEKPNTSPACFYFYVIIWIIIYSGISYQILLIGVTSRNKGEHCNWAIVPCFLHRLQSPQHLGARFRASANYFYHEISPELSKKSLFVLRWEVEITWIVCPWTNRLKYSKWPWISGSKEQCSMYSCGMYVFGS